MANPELGGKSKSRSCGDGLSACRAAELSVQVGQVEFYGCLTKPHGFGVGFIWRTLAQEVQDPRLLSGQAMIPRSDAHAACGALHLPEYSPDCLDLEQGLAKAPHREKFAKDLAFVPKDGNGATLCCCHQTIS